MARRLTKKEKAERAAGREEALVKKYTEALGDEDQNAEESYHVMAPDKKYNRKVWSMDIICNCCMDGIVSHSQFESRTQSGMLKKALRYAKKNGSLDQ